MTNIEKLLKISNNSLHSLTSLWKASLVNGVRGQGFTILCEVNVWKYLESKCKASTGGGGGGIAFNLNELLVENAISGIAESAEKSPFLLSY